LCMDSGNMHLGALAGVPVVSVWGGTHPNLGFSPLFNEQHIIQVDLPCRPATVYGKITKKWQRSCYQAAFEQISPASVAQKILQLI
jgi:ADP-heptose:LPS heptosyltransferase